MSDRKRWSSVDSEQANALASMIEAGNRGDGAAACRLGDICREEVVGLDGRSKMAFRWYLRSALTGDPGGQNNLGACYEHGLGCVQSYAKAVKWYRLATAQGLGTAAMNLGYCYLRGHGVPADKVEALRLFRVAVARGEERAAKEVGRLERDREVVRAIGSSRGPRPAIVAACPGGHAVDPSLEARSQLLLRDGPPEHLRHSRVASTESPPGSPGCESPPHARPVELLGAREGRDKQRSGGKDGRPRIRYIDVTETGKHFGLVGVAGVAPPMVSRLVGADEVVEKKGIAERHVEIPACKPPTGDGTT